jgi:CheY-like chemotaxis protein
MRILLVEDDSAKRRAIRTHLASRLAQAEFREASSFRAALDELNEFIPDLVILDMTIPSLERSTSDRDHLLVYGGRDLLRQLRRLRIPAAVIVVTQYPQFDAGLESLSLAELDEQLRAVYPEHYRGAVSFSFVYDTWREDLDRLLSGTWLS